MNCYKNLDDRAWSAYSEQTSEGFAKRCFYKKGFNDAIKAVSEEIDRMYAEQCGKHEVLSATIALDKLRDIIDEWIKED